MEPDAGIALLKPDRPFLVLEIAVSQSERDAQKKAQDYILGSQGMVALVVLVMVQRGKTSGSVAAHVDPNNVSEPAARCFSVGGQALNKHHL